MNPWRLRPEPPLAKSAQAQAQALNNPDPTNAIQ